MEKSKFDAVYDAIYDGDCSKIDSLLSASNVNAASESGWNFLHMSLISVTWAPDPKVVQHLIDIGVDVNAQDKKHWTPLHFAVRLKSDSIVRVLLDAEAMVNMPNNEGVTPLHLCLMTFPRNLEICNMLISSGANLDEDHGAGTVRNYATVAAGPDADAILDLLNKS